MYTGYSNKPDEGCDQVAKVDIFQPTKKRGVFDVKKIALITIALSGAAMASLTANLAAADDELEAAGVELVVYDAGALEASAALDQVAGGVELELDQLARVDALEPGLELDQLAAVSRETLRYERKTAPPELASASCDNVKKRQSCGRGETRIARTSGDPPARGDIDLRWRFLPSVSLIPI